MIDVSTILQGVKTVLEADATTKGYTIAINQRRNLSPSLATKKAWIGIYRAGAEHLVLTTGSQPYLSDIDVELRVQIASLKPNPLVGGDAEIQLGAVEKIVMDIIGNPNNFNYDNTVDNVTGFSVTYEEELGSEQDKTYFLSAIITIHTQARN